MKSITEILDQYCLFSTERVTLLNWNTLESKAEIANMLVDSVEKIMTPRVTQALPVGWQNLDTNEEVESWILERKSDSHCYAITLRETNEIIGFLFLYMDQGKEESNELRLGYLLKESIWRKGLGSELVKGLVEWCNGTAAFKSISGGVERDNIGSIKVLEKNGFYKSSASLADGTLLYQIDFEL